MPSAPVAPVTPVAPSAPVAPVYPVGPTMLALIGPNVRLLMTGVVFATLTGATTPKYTGLVGVQGSKYISVPFL